MLVILEVVLVVVPCILVCVQQMMDKSIKEVFIVQERDVKSGSTESNQNLTKVVNANTDIDEGFELRPWNR